VSEKPYEWIHRALRAGPNVIDMNNAEGCTSSTVTEGLTAEKLMAAIRSLPPPLPPPPAYDLYASVGLDQAYEINPPDDLRPPGSKGRKLVVVPKQDLDRWASELRRMGIDVRVEPRLSLRRSGDSA
jgi:hypothetical protein